MRHVYVNKLNDDEAKAMEMLTIATTEAYESGCKKGYHRGYWTGYGAAVAAYFIGRLIGTVIKNKSNNDQ